MNADASRHPRSIVYAIYALAAGLLALGLAFGKRDEDAINRIPRPIRMLSSALVLACALLLRRDARCGNPRDAAMPLTAAGMGCDFLGDLVMAKVIPLPEYAIFGMAAFGAGHGLYMKAFAQRMQALALRSARARWTALGSAWAVALVSWWALVRSPAIKPALNYGALAYALLLSSMSGMGAALAAQDRRYTPLALGGALFFVSDIFLAAKLFRGTRFPQIGDVVWLTYIAGQALIVAQIGLVD